MFFCQRFCLAIRCQYNTENHIISNHASDRGHPAYGTVDKQHHIYFFTQTGRICMAVNMYFVVFNCFNKESFFGRGGVVCDLILVLNIMFR